MAQAPALSSQRLAARIRARGRGRGRRRRRLRVEPPADEGAAAAAFGGLSLYATPPAHDVSLDDFHDAAARRLQLLVHATAPHLSSAELRSVSLGDMQQQLLPLRTAVKPAPPPRSRTSRGTPHPEPSPPSPHQGAARVACPLALSRLDALRLRHEVAHPLVGGGPLCLPVGVVRLGVLCAGTHLQGRWRRPPNSPRKDIGVLRCAVWNYTAHTFLFGCATAVCSLRHLRSVGTWHWHSPRQIHHVGGEIARTQLATTPGYYWFPAAARRPGQIRPGSGKHAPPAT